MLKIQLFLFLSLISYTVSCQSFGAKGAAAINGVKADSGQTYALVIGISDYQNPSITDLKFAATDAIAFANYLKDPHRGKLAPRNVNLLINEKATAANVISALYKIMESAKPNDQIILYFSGHGDVESNTISQPGFLLCWDAPSAVYMIGGTFSLIYLQELLSTLSITKKARIVFIADACRSGKLAGSSVNGTQITASNLSKQFANEVKILSCQPDELSLEGNQWGNGRGLFSYYLVEGISGAADMDQDKSISLLELDRYLSEKVPKEASPMSQIPMVLGNKTQSIARYDLQKEVQESTIITHSISSKSRPEKKIQSCDHNKKWIDSFHLCIATKKFIKPTGISAWDYLKKLINTKSCIDSIADWKQDLAAGLQNECQQAINDYLRSDPVELKKRWSFDDKYLDYPKYLEKSIELLHFDGSLDKHLKARWFYFKGLNFRMEGERKRHNHLLDSAETALNQCIALQPNAAFAYNELGLIARRKKNFTLAIEHFTQAIQHSPRWSLPLSNLCVTFLDLKLPQQAIGYGIAATLINDSLPLAYYNLGTAYFEMNQWNLAVTQFNKTIALDSNYAKAYYNLGLSFYQLEQYDAAKNTMLKYSSKRPEDEDGWKSLGEICRKLNLPESAEKYFNKALQINSHSFAAHESFGEYYWDQGKFQEAYEHFIQCRQIDDSNAQVYFYLSRYHCHVGQWEEAEQHLEKAFQRGFSNIDLLMNDPHMQNALNRETIQSIISHYKKK